MGGKSVMMAWWWWTGRHYPIVFFSPFMYIPLGDFHANIAQSVRSNYFNCLKMELNYSALYLRALICLCISMVLNKFVHGHRVGRRPGESFVCLKFWRYVVAVELLSLV